MTVAMGIVAALLAFLVLLLLPLSVLAEGAAGDDELWGQAELRWGYAIARLRFRSEAGLRLSLFGIPIYRADSFRARGEKKKDAEAKEKPEKEKAGKRSLIERLQRFAGDRELVFAMIQRALRALHARLYVGGTLGLGDPAKTAVVLAAFREIDRRLPEAIDLDLRDEYLYDIMQLQGRFKSWLMPAELLWIALLWLARRDTRRVLLNR